MWLTLYHFVVIVLVHFYYNVKRVELFFSNETKLTMFDLIITVTSNNINVGV